ncbi:hypothetical protein HHI36_008275 [Cryptolaemus montrouzieri]|uniref:Fringe-like glycosyltransferase domain-containing protein n=1 Tax=Cryptolaemus montrouzieri TaxID=559131 RepID=A0ABD2MS98_9CUCU
MKFIGVTLNIFYFLTLAQGFMKLSTVTFVILSQENKYNAQTAKNLKLDICEQASALSQACPVIYLSHEEFPIIGEWTILPILPKLAKITQYSRWIIFIEERTLIRLKLLLETLNKYDSNEKIWVGYSLEDETPTIIHHFQEKLFKYPHLGAGIALTGALLRNVSKRISLYEDNANFSIDKSFELALFIWNNGNGTLLEHDPAFCVQDDERTCASFAKPFQTCELAVPINSVHFAVKTCGKFHKDRVSVVLNTWARYAHKINFFSDIKDDVIPTISLGIPNTESGHCGKTIASLQFLNAKIEDDSNVQWIIVTDDDTILSVSRLLQVLSCYDSKDDVALGERYGYEVYNSLGFNYITGGGGMALSRALVGKLVKSCRCPSISAPDDMVLGHCIATLGVKITHSHLFHQARPVDYAPDFLVSDKHVSFHKHWMIDPVEVYNHWFADEDSKLIRNLNIKNEL